ncbi:MAG TPA: PepSY-associated TM helix domain-containing protein [Methylocella sp.]|nr:PepSY-associated TM helix domain-containing protein [Methylocella sp.]
MAEEIGKAAVKVGAARAASLRRASGRRLWVKVHRTIGLFLGAVFVVVGLTGSILAFWQTIDEWLNKDIMIVAAPSGAVSYRPLDEILAASRAAAPPNGIPAVLTMPRHAKAAASVSYTVSTKENQQDQYEVFVDPYTAKATGRRFLQHGASVFSMPLIRTIISLHASLLFGDDRRYVVGIPAIFLLVSVLVGLYLWWPRNGNWRHALTIKWGATPVRLTYDVHKTTGLYLAIVLIVMLFSGIYIVFRPQVQFLVSLFSPVREEPKDLKSTPIPGQQPLGLDATAAIANQIFPDGKLHWIFIPQGRDGVYVIGKQADDEPNRWSTNRNVTIDQYSGQVLYVQDRANFTVGETFLEWQYPLHCGEAFGNSGRTFIMLMGFVPLILYVTGFLRWRQKRRARR